MPSRMAARSTTAGHAGEVLQQHARRRERDSSAPALLTSHRASASMSAALTKRPSSWRSRFSSRIFIEYGRRAISGNPAASRAGRLKIWTLRPPTCRVVRVPKLFTVGMGSKPHENENLIMSRSRQETSRDDLRDVLVPRVGGVVHRLHVVGGDAARQALERGAHLRIAQQRRGARDRRRVVGRKVVPVVLELDEIEALDQAGRRVAGDEIDLAARQRAVAEREIHHAAARREPQAVRLRQAGIAVRPLEKLVAEARPPARRLPRRIVDRLEAERAGVAAAHENRERVVEAERRQQRASAPRVQIAHGREHRAGVRADRLMKDRRQRRAGVLDVDVDVAGHQRAIADQRAAQIQPALDRRARCRARSSARGARRESPAR